MTKQRIARPCRITRIRISLLPNLSLKAPPLPMPTTPVSRVARVARAKMPPRAKKNRLMGRHYSGLDLGPLDCGPGSKANSKSQRSYRDAQTPTSDGRRDSGAGPGHLADGRAGV